MVGEDVIDVVLVPAGIDRDLASQSRRRRGSCVTLARERAADNPRRRQAAASELVRDRRCLSDPALGQNVVVLAAERRLTVANEQDRRHGC